MLRECRSIAGVEFWVGDASLAAQLHRFAFALCTILCEFVRCAPWLMLSDSAAFVQKQANRTCLREGGDLVGQL